MFSQSKRDILEKLLADISEIVARLMGFAPIDALEEIQEYYQAWLGLDKKQIDPLSGEELLAYLLDEKDFQVSQLELLAELLAVEGEILWKNKQNSASCRQLQKALAIFDHVDRHSDLFSFSRRETISRTEQYIKKILEK